MNAGAKPLGEVHGAKRRAQSQTRACCASVRSLFSEAQRRGSRCCCGVWIGPPTFRLSPSHLLHGLRKVRSFICRGETRVGAYSGGLGKSATKLSHEPQRAGPRVRTVTHNCLRKHFPLRKKKSDEPSTHAQIYINPNSTRLRYK